MSNVPLMFQPLVKYANFQGRARRSEFWQWILFRILLGMALGVGLICMIVPHLALLQGNDDNVEIRRIMFTQIMPFVGLISVVNLALLIPTLAVAVRRLHDTGRTGWWVIMPHVVALFGAIVFMVLMFETYASSLNNFIPENEAMAFILRSLGTAMLTIYLPTFIAAVVLIIFYLTDGKAGPNKFGDDPKGRGAPQPSSLMSPEDAPEEMH